MDTDAGVDARLRAGGVTFEACDVELLRAIDDAGSVNAAASELGRSRARALSRLDDLEAAFGDLVVRRRGGSGGGGTSLTDEARALLERYERLRSGVEGVAETDETVFEGRVADRTGELGVVETDAGGLQALTPPGETDVTVAVRADAVTLHEPGEAPEAGGTSARNRFSGTVERVDRGDAIAHVYVDVGSAEPLAALVTTESVDRLGLDPGTPVVATFKATATRATPAER